MKTICVFCSARTPNNDKYIQVCEDLGALIAKQGYTLMYGGSRQGCMDILSNAARKNGGRTIGVLPEVFSHLANDDSTIIAAKDFAERKAYMMTHADAFFCLPGSFGTLDEMTDMLVGKLLTIHTKPVVLINTDGFYDDLLKQFAKAVQVGMAEPNDGLFAAVDTPQQALEYLRTYVPKKRTHKGIRG